ncbi:peptidoglycan-binding protein [cf. Phormidesmis sp. LEGE 11477]|uniref:peptidoglycan-binding domain-containing protein n=1 Tax=cf. Phormidesmis sp. LEGE 11477 TaxID=1828680 RepID=UPI001881DC0B|nr:peptidoglycan-binding protein [cf. Phormidesmis sp. LEGE 11477]MBE9061987.1 peptidoglycan-binding protein [cf. Phormidesmis sp. LEGE 11477]
MVSKPFFQYLKTKTTLISALLTSTAISAFVAVPAGASILYPTNRSSALTPQTLTPQSQIAQTPTIVYPTLRDGSTGETVSRLQATLKLLGFYQGDVDGIYSQLTQQAVSAFQSATNLTADGITGPATWRKLLPTPSDISESTTGGTASTTETSNPEAPVESALEQTATNPAESSPPMPILRPSAEGSAVSQLQRELQTLGYYDSTIDGKYGELTEAAVREFQADQQLVVDAIVGPSTWAAIRRELQN